MVLNNDCPELPLYLTLELIAELEQAHETEVQRKAAVRSLLQAPLWPKEEAFVRLKAEIKTGRVSQGVASWARTLFPELPTEVLEGVIPSGTWSPWRLPFNRRRRRSQCAAAFVCGRTKMASHESIGSVGGRHCQRAKSA